MNIILKILEDLYNKHLMINVVINIKEKILIDKILYIYVNNVMRKKLKLFVENVKIIVNGL